MLAENNEGNSRRETVFFMKGKLERKAFSEREFIDSFPIFFTREKLDIFSRISEGRENLLL